MANYLDTTAVPVAAPEKNKFDLGMQHITTSDFMELDCAYVKECVPGEKVDINMETFSRMNAMPVPGFGRAVIKKTKFAVPFRQICPNFNDFISDTVHINASYNPEANVIPQGIPTISNRELVELFVGDVTLNPQVSGESYTDRAMLFPYNPIFDNSYDINVATAVTSASTSYVGYNFTDNGRNIYKALQALGYDIVWSHLAKENDLAEFNKDYSLLPLLGWIKIYADYYWPSQYSNIDLYQYMQMVCKVDTGSPVSISVDMLRRILKQIVYVQYDSNFFSAQWDTPSEPSYGNYSDNYRINNIDKIQLYDASRNAVNPVGFGNGFVGNSSAPDSGSNNFGVNGGIAGANAPFISSYIPALQGTTNRTSVTPISEYLLKSLKSLTAFMKRNQLVGSRAYDRLMARYGVSTPSEKLQRAIFLGSETQSVQISDVTSTSDTGGAQLGAFAGKGMSYGQTHLTYDTDEFCYVYIFTSIVPIAQQYQGVDPIVLRGVDGRLSYYVPEFDSLGVEATPSLTMYLPTNYNGNWTGYTQQVFGFMPRYASYKSAVHDKLTGNFRVKSLNGTNPLFPNLKNGASSWHLMREFDDYDYTSGASVVHSVDFMLGRNDNWQYKRIFYGGPLNEMGVVNPDNFTLIHNFEVASYAPMKKLYDVIDELNADDEHTHGKVRMQVNGVKVN